MTQQTPLYKRVLVKISGEALMGDLDHGIDITVLSRIAKEIKCHRRSGSGSWHRHWCR